jgi:thymidylate kinase
MSLRARRAAGRRRGFTVALIGCDGAGKTTVARALEQDPALPIRYLYMGVSGESSNRRLPTSRLADALKRAAARRSANGAGARATGPDGPHGANGAAGAPTATRGRRSGARAALRLANRLGEEWYRQLIAEAYRARGAIVVFDRHFLADYHAFDVAGSGRPLSRRIHGWMLAHTYPRPDLAVFLDAPPDVLHARKGEGTIASLTRRREDYRGLVDSGEAAGSCAVVSATQPLDVVIHEVTGLIHEHATRR